MSPGCLGAKCVMSTPAAFAHFARRYSPPGQSVAPPFRWFSYTFSGVAQVEGIGPGFVAALVGDDGADIGPGPALELVGFDGETGEARA